MKQVRKRNGELENFDPNKIINAVTNAFHAVKKIDPP